MGYFCSNTYRYLWGREIQKKKERGGQETKSGTVYHKEASVSRCDAVSYTVSFQDSAWAAAFLRLRIQVPEVPVLILDLRKTTFLLRDWGEERMCSTFPQITVMTLSAVEPLGLAASGDGGWSPLRSWLCSFALWVSRLCIFLFLDWVWKPARVGLGPMSDSPVFFFMLNSSGNPSLAFYRTNPAHISVLCLAAQAFQQWNVSWTYGASFFPGLSPQMEALRSLPRQIERKILVFGEMSR